MTDKKVVLVTGASQGIGLATAKLFAENGYAVAIVDVKEEQAQNEAKKLNAAGLEAKAFSCNISDEKQVSQTVDAILTAYGHLDVAVNNAGVHQTPHIDLTDMPVEQYERITSVNLRGLWACMKYEIPVMKSQKGSFAIVNVSSIGGLVGAAGESVYTATKHGILGMTKAVAKECAKSGIRVNAVCPGTIHTPMCDALFAATEGMEQKIVETVPMGRLGEAAEIAEAIFWLASPKASYVTGEALVVDGGATA